MSDAPVSRRAVFLDRDGTLNRDVGYPHRVEDLELLDGVIEGLTWLSRLGFRLFVTTNQSGIARGYFSEAQLHAFHRAMSAQLQAAGISLDGIYYCPLHPAATEEVYRRESPLRKPGPGMILLAAKEHHLDLANSFAVGDRMRDVLAGQAAGCRGILVQTGPASQAEELPRVVPDFVAHDLVEAASWIERQMVSRWAGASAAN